jgi:hypothetical protein
VLVRKKLYRDLTLSSVLCQVARRKHSLLSSQMHWFRLWSVPVGFVVRTQSKPFASKLVGQTHLNMLDPTGGLPAQNAESSDSQSFNRCIDDCIKGFDAKTKVSRRRGGTEGTPARTVGATTIRRKLRLMFWCPWRNVIQVQTQKAVVQACIGKQQTTHDKPIQRRLRAFYDSRDSHVWFHDVLVAPGSPAPAQYGGSSDVLSSKQQCSTAVLHAVRIRHEQ